MTKSKTPTPTPAPAGVQHRYSTRKQKAALEALDALVPDAESLPLSKLSSSSAHVAGKNSPPVLDEGPGAGDQARTMADILGSINLLALSQDGTEMGRMLLVLSGAVERIEGERGSEEDVVGKHERNDKGSEEGMRAKMMFVKMVAEEVGIGDRKRLRGLLRWVVDVVGEFGKELDVLDWRRG